MSSEGYRKILHLDLDAFYPSVEVLDDPALAGKPVIVGGLGPRGVVASASYEARQHQVHSALPMAVARRRCPDGVFLRPRFKRYRELSRQVFDIYREWTDLLEPLSLDEAYLDVTHRPEPAAVIARTIKQRIRDDTGLTVSAGVAANKFLAKLGSDHDKPDGLTVIEPVAARRFIAPLPVRKLWGVGPATAELLHAAGLRTIGEIARADEAALREVVGNSAPRLRALAHGRDARRVSRPGRPRSISAETTFDQNIHSWEAAAEPIRRFADRLAASLQRRELRARTVVLKVRYGDFDTITRSLTPARPVRTRDQILAHARELARRVERPPREGIRLIGLGVHNLVGPEEAAAATTRPKQLELF